MAALLHGAVLALLSAAVCCGASPHAAARAEAPGGETLEVGHATLHRCGNAAWCGVLPRPLDPTGAVDATVPIYFEYYPHTAAAPAEGMLVAAEGGPGYATTDSREAYLKLFGPLRDSYDVLLMDYRGTGRSGAIDCSALQRAPQLTERDIGACGRALGRTAPLYSTALAADDLAAILDALGVARIGLYGDSYGTYFSQVFALRHRERLRSLVLDGAYPLSGPDYAWYPNYAIAMRRKFDLACERSRPCHAIPGSSMEHIAPALRELRAHPFAAHVRYRDGRTLDFTADASALAVVMFAGSPAYASVRELDAAARAFSSGDRLPLLRLMAETLGSVDSRDATYAPEEFSEGLAAAVTCEDPPHIFDMHLPPSQRMAQRDRMIAAREASAPGTYAPFTIAEYRRMPLDYTFIDECVTWPTMAPAAKPLTFEGVRYPQVPVLVVSGELDNMTSVADGAAAAAHFPHARHVIIANSFHVNAVPHARSGCAATIVRRFMAELQLGGGGDDDCAAAVPPVPLVPRFARRLHELHPAQALPGNQGDDEALRLVSAALLTSADVITRAEENGVGHGVGLRGGEFTAARQDGGYELTLHEVHWTEDLAVSGRIESPGRSGVVQADLEVHSPAAGGQLTLSWPEGASDARASVRGTFGGKMIAAEAPAP